MVDETATPVEEVTPEIPPLPQVTSAAEWKRKAKARWLFTLPSSGSVVKLRKPKWEQIFNAIPDKASEILNFAATSPADVIKGSVPLAKALVPYILIEPRIGLGENDITVDDFDEIDLMALFAWARAGGAIGHATEVPE